MGTLAGARSRVIRCESPVFELDLPTAHLPKSPSSLFSLARAPILTVGRGESSAHLPHRVAGRADLRAPTHQGTELRAEAVAIMLRICPEPPVPGTPGEKTQVRAGNHSAQVQMESSPRGHARAP